MATRLIDFITTTTLLGLASVLISGCAMLHPAPTTNTHTELAPITKLLFYSRALLNASPAERMAMLTTAKDSYKTHTTAANAARLAMAYGLPGYKGYAPAKAQHYAQKALELGQTHWRAAATTYLKQFAALCADSANVRKKLANAREQRRKIKQQLAHARDKIHALTRLEAELKP